MLRRTHTAGPEQMPVTLNMIAAMPSRQRTLLLLVDHISKGNVLYVEDASSSIFFSARGV
jgi:hypothetical protein